MSTGGDPAHAGIQGDKLERILKMRSTLAEHPNDQGKGWDRVWETQQVPPWDDGGVQPALRELVEEGKFQLPKSGRALVPGCGRGYDAAFFGQLGFHTVGLDISTVGVKKASEWLASQPNPPKNVSFQEADFFTFPNPKPFDLIYDYTFHCALPPSLRKAWAVRMADLLSPGGILITLIYPIDGDRQGGPPFSVSVDGYRALLEDTFENVLLEEPTRSVEGHKGREMIAVWRRREVGSDA